MFQGDERTYERIFRMRGTEKEDSDEVHNLWTQPDTAGSLSTTTSSPDHSFIHF
jgi:hypothetical protein